MRNLRLLMLGLLGLFVGQAAWAQTCSPDTTLGGVPGLYPDSLPDGNINSPYTTVVHVIFPQDTSIVVSGFPLDIDLCSVKLDSIGNLPAGMTYACNNDSCEWEIDHTPGAVNRACATLTGTPTAAAPTDSIIIYATAVPGTYNQATGCTPTTLQIPPEFTTISYKVRLFLDVPVSADDALANMELNLFPNPTTGAATLRFDLPQAEVATIQLLDGLGREVQALHNGFLTAGPHTFRVGDAQLPAGMYLLRVKLGDGTQVLTRKWIKR